VFYAEIGNKIDVKIEAEAVRNLLRFSYFASIYGETVLIFLGFAC
jgi:hypothetical protein